MAKRVSIIMPALNEAGSIAEVLKGIPLEELAGRGYETEILVVDNRSTDGTRRVAEERGVRV